MGDDQANDVDDNDSAQTDMDDASSEENDAARDIANEVVGQHTLAYLTAPTQKDRMIIRTRAISEAIAAARHIDPNFDGSTVSKKWGAALELDSMGKESHPFAIGRREF